MCHYALFSLALVLMALISVPALAQHQHGQQQADQPRPGIQQPYGKGKAGMSDRFSPEHQELVAKLHADHRQAVMHLKLQLRAKLAELDVYLAAPQADQAKIVTVSDEITALQGQILALQNEFRRQVFEETGQLLPGRMHGSKRDQGMGGQGMMSRRGMMGGRGMNCPMMSGQQPEPEE
jgi:hypothetical protein